MSKLFLCAPCSDAAPLLNERLETKGTQPLKFRGTALYRGIRTCQPGRPLCLSFSGASYGKEIGREKREAKWICQAM